MQPNRFRSRIIITAGLIVIAVVIIATLIRMYDNRLEVQAALDAACGQGVVLESSGTYDFDPIWGWYSPQASCFKDISSNKIACACN